MLLICGSATGAARVPDDVVHVEAKLLRIDRAPGCGVIAFVSPGKFLIVRGPPEMAGRSAELLIPCIELHGEDSFQVGHVQDLYISESNPAPFDWVRWSSTAHGSGPGLGGKKWYVVSKFSGADTPVQGGDKVVLSARAQVGVTVHYDPAYARIAYPMGDVPIERGVCADVLVRAFRADGIDLQKLVHEDMAVHFTAYPHAWGLHRPDTNIDHRRVPNLEAFFRRKGMALPVTALAADYRAGDIVSWRLPNGLAHIGLVSDRADAGRPLMLHNIGAGTQEEDVLFAWKIVGHFRWPFAAAPVR